MGQQQIDALEVAGPEHYRASRAVVGGGPLRQWGSPAEDPIGLAHWRAPPVDIVAHVNDAHPTILFHAAGGRVRSERCNRFRAGGTGFPGDAMLVPVGADVRCRWSEPVEYLHVYFKPGFLEEQALETYGRPIGELQDRSHIREERIATELTRLSKWNWDAAPDPLLVEAVAGRLAQVALETFSPLGGAVQERHYRIAPHRMRAVVELIESSLGCALRVADLAAAAGLSASHFTRAFMAETGCTPYRYVLGRRIEHVKRHITAGGMSAAEIAAACGFSSVPHLSATFAGLTGMGLKEWRRLRR